MGHTERVVRVAVLEQNERVRGVDAITRTLMKIARNQIRRWADARRVPYEPTPVEPTDAAFWRAVSEILTTGVRLDLPRRWTRWMNPKRKSNPSSRRFARWTDRAAEPKASHFAFAPGRPVPPLSANAIDPEPVMRKNVERKTKPIRTIRHTESGHSVDRAELLRSERVRKIISEVAVKLKISRTVGSRGSSSKTTW